jgi:DNA modification methylase
MPFEEVTIGSARLIRGDCRDVLSKLPAESVHCCVTSPPYFGLRDYGVAGQIGLEPTPAAYIANLVEIMRQVRRVLRTDGTLWLNIGDSYAAATKGSGGHNPKQDSNRGSWHEDHRWRIPMGCKPKDLLGIPWMLAFALRDDGWYLRRDIIWHKPNPMPESVTDRPTTAHEYLFLLTKAPQYFFDAEAIKEGASDCKGGLRFTEARARAMGRQPSGNERHDNEQSRPITRNKRSVWTIATAPFRGAHFATFPPGLVEPCILAGTSERGVCPKCGRPWARVVAKSTTDRVYDRGACASDHRAGTPQRSGAGSGALSVDTETIGWRPICSCKAKGIAKPIVIDPFGGAATTALTASRLGRSGISIELSSAYHDIACERIAAAQPTAAAA